jgi:hypothetical protein
MILQHDPPGPHSGHGYSVRDLRALVLWLSDERDRLAAALAAAEKRAYARGRDDGARPAEAWHLGWEAAEEDMARSWRALARPIAHPAQVAEERIRAAIAGERSDALEFERAFVAKAYNTRARDRSDAQAAAVLAYPPPEPKRRGRRAGQ